MSGESIANQTRPHPRDLVCHNIRPDTAATHGDAAFYMSISHRLGQWNNEIGVVIIGHPLQGAVVNERMSGFFQPAGHLLFQRESPVIGGYSYAHMRSP